MSDELNEVVGIDTTVKSDTSSVGLIEQKLSDKLIEPGCVVEDRRSPACGGHVQNLVDIVDNSSPVDSGHVNRAEIVDRQTLSPSGADGDVDVAENLGNPSGAKLPGSTRPCSDVRAPVIFDRSLLAGVTSELPEVSEDPNLAVFDNHTIGLLHGVAFNQVAEEVSPNGDVLQVYSKKAHKEEEEEKMLTLRKRNKPKKKLQKILSAAFSPGCADPGCADSECNKRLLPLDCEPPSSSGKSNCAESASLSEDTGQSALSESMAICEGLLPADVGGTRATQADSSHLTSSGAAPEAGFAWTNDARRVSYSDVGDDVTRYVGLIGSSIGGATRSEKAALGKR